MTGDDVTYDDDTGQYLAEFDADDPESIPDVVVFGLAEIREQDAIEMPPLGDVVDPDALGSIFRPALDSPNNVSITFEYCGYVVTVHDSGSVTFEKLD